MGNGSAGNAKRLVLFTAVVSVGTAILITGFLSTVFLPGSVMPTAMMVAGAALLGAGLVILFADAWRQRAAWISAGGTRLRRTGPPVRPEPRLGPAKFAWGFIGLAFGAGLIFAMVGGISQLRLLTESQTAIGVVEAKRFIESRGAGRSYVPPSYQLDYQFVAADGRRYAGRDDVGPDAWRSVAVGNQIPIAYDQRDPGDNQIARSTEQQVWLLTGWALGVMLCAICVVVATSSLRRTFRRESVARALSSGGTETEAEVTGHKTESGTLRIVKYRYVDADGRGHRGEGPYMYPEDADGWSVGSGVRVRYDPARPGDSIWLDDANWSRSGKGGVRSV